jgi:hypothetical protein
VFHLYFLRDLFPTFRIVATDMKPAHFARTLICVAILALFVGQSRAYGPDGTT